MYKWWFHIYNIMYNFIDDGGISTKDLVENMHKFMAQSNLAEFECRLNLIYTFHCYSIHLGLPKRTGKLLNV